MNFMIFIADHFIPSFAPLADPDAVINAPGWRITVLTGQLLRIEYSPEDRFEDRPSQPFGYRSQAVVDYKTGDGGPGTGDLWVETEHLRLVVRPGQPPAPETLAVELKGLDHTWHYGDPDTGNLMGTYRTLDAVDGAVMLEPGLLSRDGWVVVDDSSSLVFDKSGWLTPRGAPKGQLDLYFFGHGHDYRAALNDFRKISGPVPMLPRWALGNWWSRYWAYTDAELRELIEDFDQHDIPLSVCIIDMDWHITETGNASSGWTGYTWNRELFPDPDDTIRFIHEHGLKTALNLHPASGIHPHEAAYGAFAGRMGVDPQSQAPIPFDLASPRFAQAYFELLHHPEEERGVDFWWIDWQQGALSALPGLDPLWWLNHLHFLDHGRSQPQARLARRPFIFSRWGGLGNHRYPIGFSGDTIITWESLGFQPYFTSTAANVCYGWWSHDIGGHYGGVRDAELYIRWVQFGMLSPILRLHSTKNAQLERRPFGWDAETERLAGDAMRTRHRLIPYLYSMAWRDHALGESPFRPMYHDYAEERAAYFCPDQYTFGSELIAAPHIRARDKETGLSRQVVWLPHRAWDFFTGEPYPAGWHAVHGGLDDVPLFAGPGSIVPLCDPEDWREPEFLEVHVFPGASNEFRLYEDDGVSPAYLEGEYRLTAFNLDWADGEMCLRIQPDSAQRTFRILFRALAGPAEVSATMNGEPLIVGVDYDEESRTLTVSPPDIEFGDDLILRIAEPELFVRGGEEKITALRRMVAQFNLGNTARQVLHEGVADIVQDPAALPAFRVVLSDRQMRSLLEVLLGAGLHTLTHAGEPRVMVWNREGRPEIGYELSTEHFRRWLAPDRFRVDDGRVPPFKGWALKTDLPDTLWRLSLRYGDLLTVREPRGPLRGQVPPG